ncbi:MAG: InlB B-repeat-containing protein [Lachnospiraceae bacterium]|nr:InlB B-repeat-containing protein [Lachnospiraceae bacterium]
MYRMYQMNVKLLTTVIAMSLFLQCTTPVLGSEISYSETTQTAPQEGSSLQSDNDSAVAEAAASSQTEAASHEDAMCSQKSDTSLDVAPPQAEAAPREDALYSQKSDTSLDVAPPQAETAPHEDALYSQKPDTSLDVASPQKETAPTEDGVSYQADSAVSEDSVSTREAASEDDTVSSGKKPQAENAVSSKEEAQAEGAVSSKEETQAGDAASSHETVTSSVNEALKEELVGAADKGVYYYRSKDDNADIPDIYIYDDDLLKGNSLEYRAELATMSLSLVNASISSTRGVYGDEENNSKSQNLRAFLEDNGFGDFKANPDYSKEPTLDTTAVACAHKKIIDDGKEYTLLVIAPRSAGYKAEWGRNFTLGENGDHQGFTMAKEKVLDFTREYIKEMGLEGDIKIWIAGGSRGAGIVNLVGTELLRDSESALGDSVSLTPENLYCYTFGTPHTADVTSEDYQANNDTKYAYIHNLSETNDIVGTFAPSNMGFDRYGVTTGYTDNELKDSMLTYLKAISEVVYNKFISGGNPDTFTSLNLDYEALLKNKKLSLEPASEGDYLYGKTQDDFLRTLESSMTEVFKDRQTYTAYYQNALEHFFGYVYGKSGEMGALFNGAAKSDYAIPVAAGMYISTTLERSLKSGNGITDEETVENLKASISELETAINQMQENGFELDPDMLAEYDALKERLKTAETLEKPDHALVDLCWNLTATFYSKAIEAGLKNVTTLDDETKELLISDEDSMAMTKALSYLLLADAEQDQNSAFTRALQQFSHLATVIGNAKSFMTPHYNEVILAWLRAQDPNYRDFEKANTAQATGYRRVFVEQPEGVDVTGTVKDSAGNVVAVFNNGELEYATDIWIGITTSDGGNWLRLPLDETYLIDFSTSVDTTIKFRVSEYSVDTGKEVRVETSDSKYNWQDFSIRPVDSACLVVSAVEGDNGVYTLGSDAEYYFDLLKRFYITYNLNGGSLDGTNGSLTLLYDDGTGIKLPAPTREGYIFAYWEGSRFNAGDPFTVLGDHVFKAVWKKKADENTKPEDKKPEDKKPEKKEYQQEVRETAANTLTKVSSSSTLKKATDTLQRAKAADTADTTPIAFWLFIMAVSMSAMVAMTARSRQKKNA